MVIQLGRYEALKRIAKGGMATVYLGRALGEGGFERLVAIKVMDEQFTDQPEFEAMFLDEARLAARIRHPNVVPTLDVQRTAEGMFLVMEYVEGPTLTAVLRELRERDESLPLGITLRLFVDLLAGLHEAHQLADGDGNRLNLVHRDVSPQNILLGGDGITRITDFGVARASVRLSSTVSGEIKGKLGYMAPEQLLGDGLDARTDVYSAGVVLWEALTGQRLFRADDAGALITSVLAGVRVTPAELNPDVPAAVDEVCMAALSGSPAERPASAAEFADALEGAAREADLSLISTRKLGVFVKQLECFGRSTIPRELLKEPPSFTGSGSVPGATTGGGHAMGSPPSAIHAEASMSQAPRARRGSAKGLIIGLAVGICGIGLGVLLARGGAHSWEEPAAGASAPPDGESTAAVASASAAAADPVTVGQPMAEELPSDGGPIADAGAEGPSPPGDSTPAVGVRPSPVHPVRPHSRGPGVAPPRNPDDYHPSGL